MRFDDSANVCDQSLDVQNYIFILLLVFILAVHNASKYESEVSFSETHNYRTFSYTSTTFPTSTHLF